MANPNTDIIIPIRNRTDCLQGLIATLYQHTAAYRLILVDDNSSPEEAAVIREIAAQRRTTLLIRTEFQRWYTRAVNLGLRMARTPRVVTLNTDCVVDAGWLEELYSVWDEVEAQGNKVGMVGSILSAEEPRRYTEYRVGKHGEGADYITGHAVLCSMSALFAIAEARGTPGIFFSELDQQQIHIASDRIGSWEMQKLGYSTIAAFHSAVGHAGGQSWNHNLGMVLGLSLSDVNDTY